MLRLCHISITLITVPSMLEINDNKIRLTKYFPPGKIYRMLYRIFHLVIVLMPFVNFTDLSVPWKLIRDISDLKF